MYRARKMTAKELAPNELHTLSTLRRFCVEHESGQVVASRLTWSDACAEATKRNTSELAKQLATLA